MGSRDEQYRHAIEVLAEQVLWLGINALGTYGLYGDRRYFDLAEADYHAAIGRARELVSSRKPSQDQANAAVEYLTHRARETNDDAD